MQDSTRGAAAQLSARPRGPQSSSFWPAFWLGVALCATKVYRVYWPPWYGYWEIRRYVGELAMVAAADVLFALVAGLAAQIVLSVNAGRPRVQRLFYWGFVAFGTASVLYGALSARIYDVLHTPLTFPLLSLGTDLANMHSSIEAYLTRDFYALMIGLPLAYLLAVVGSERWLRFRRTPAIRVAQGLALAAIAAVCALGHHQVHSPWGQRYNFPKLWANPHYVLLSSWGKELTGENTPTLPADFPREYLNDFTPSTAEREPTTGLARGPKNVIVIVGESVATQHLSLYGSKLNTWPLMEAEAAHSLVFRNYYSHVANTSNALFTLTLSRYAPLDWRNATDARPREPGTTVAQILKARGYRTAFISGGDNEYASQHRFLEGRGYGTVRDAGDAPGPYAFSWGSDDATTVDMLLRFIDRDQTRPFYIFAWTQATHHPFHIPPQITPVDFVQGDASLGDLPVDLNRYANALAELDRQLARLFGALRARGLAEKTSVIVTGDHGQAFGAPHPGHFHSGNLYDEDVRVPLVIWSPALFPGGQTSETVGAHVDLAPTVLDLLGVPAPPGWHGRSLLRPSESRRAYFFGMRNDYLFGVREGSLKYIFNSTAGSDELYDLRADPLEQHNLSPGQPEVRHRLRQRIAAWIEFARPLRRPAGGVGREASAQSATERTLPSPRSLLPTPH